MEDTIRLIEDFHRSCSKLCASLESMSALLCAMVGFFLFSKNTKTFSYRTPRHAASQPPLKHFSYSFLHEISSFSFSISFLHFRKWNRLVLVLFSWFWALKSMRMPEGEGGMGLLMIGICDNQGSLLSSGPARPEVLNKMHNISVSRPVTSARIFIFIPNRQISFKVRCADWQTQLKRKARWTNNEMETR